MCDKCECVQQTLLVMHQFLCEGDVGPAGDIAVASWDDVLM